MIKKIWRILKRISFVGNTYETLIGKKKRERIIKNRIELLQDKGTEIIDKVESTLIQYKGLTYFADYGTLLGIIRDKHFIDGDYDIDYSLIIDSHFEWNRFEKIMVDSGFKKIHEFRYKNMVREQTYSYGDLTIDFFGKQDNGINSIAWGFYKNEGFKYVKDEEFHVKETRYDSIEGTQKYSFNGINVTIPVNYETYLECIYGPGWIVPDPNWVDTDNNVRKIQKEVGLGFGYFYD